MRTTWHQLVLVCACSIGLTQSTAAQSGVDVARAYRDAHAPAIVRGFADMLRYPNRARDLDDVTRAAEYIREQMREAGIETQLLSLEGVPPLVFGELRVPGATRTLGLLRPLRRATDRPVELDPSAVRADALHRGDGGGGAAARAAGGR